MTVLDWFLVAAYLGGTLLLGLWLARRGAKSMVDFFVGGRAIPWWLAATSMAATTFNVDTPLYVAGVVARRGVAGNWEWWSFAFAHVLLAVLLLLAAFLPPGLSMSSRIGGECLVPRTKASRHCEPPQAEWQSHTCNEETASSPLAPRDDS